LKITHGQLEDFIHIGAEKKNVEMCNVLIPDVKKYINFSREIHKELHHSMAHQKRYIYIYRVSQEKGTKLRECVPYVKIYRYNPKHLYPKLNGYGDNGQRSLKL
jgi:hypothetical protein